ncbi:hypothetical protein BKA61DRAFT_672535 [Leptodontidium sp. MPI-SDFR-AT-0119]|nr:hypothetical protein BKA61DRAFT_672535 [Leptodontidium sp. MPI-SDFR-AT-0119]
MLNALDWLQIAAVDLHYRVFAVNALTKTFLQEFGVGAGEKGPVIVERVDYMD